LRETGVLTGGNQINEKKESLFYNLKKTNKVGVRKEEEKKT